MFASAWSLRRNVRYLIRRPNESYASIDGLRAIAVLLVVASHLAFTTQFFVPDAAAQFSQLPGVVRLAVQGYLGVDVFFVISGFLIGGMLFREYRRLDSIDLASFFARRALRLMPLYWIAIALTVAIVSFGGQSDMHVMGVVLHENVGDVWKNLLYINNFFRPSEQFGAMSHSWSLAVEEQFYLIFPPLLLLYFRSGMRSHPVKLVVVVTLAYIVIRIAARVHSLGLFAAECGYSQEELRYLNVNPLTMLSSEKVLCLFGVENDVMFDNLYTRYIALFAGVVAAFLTTFRSEELSRFYAQKVRGGALAWGCIAAIGLNLALPLLASESGLIGAMYQSFLQQLAFSAAVACLILTCIHARGGVVLPIQKFLSLRVFYVIAQMSYSIYLFNILLINISYRFAEQRVGSTHVSTLVGSALPLFFPATVVVSFLAYILIERPFMNLRSAILDRSGGPDSFADVTQQEAGA